MSGSALAINKTFFLSRGEPLVAAGGRRVSVKCHVPPSLRGWLDKFAAEDGVSVSKYFGRVIEAHLKNAPSPRNKPAIDAPIELPARRRKAIYLIRLNGLTKIGKSVEPERRIKNMQLPGKPDWVYIAWSANADEDEKKLHRWFASSRRYGEWFELSTEQAQHALTMVSADKN